MGTRNLTCVWYKGRFYIAQYCQWDGYPDGQGVTIWKFLIDPTNIARLKEGMNHIIELEYDEAGELKTDKSLIDSHHASLHRDTGAKILETVASATDENRVPIDRELDFINDGVFCEWAWVVDLNKEVMEMYHGGGIAETRFAEVGGGALGCMKTMPFKDLPKTQEEFLEAFQGGY